MRRSILFIVLGICCQMVFAQNTIIPNNSFENWWNDTTYVINDVGDAWLHDTVDARSADAAYGDYALYLKTSGQNEDMGNSNVSYVIFGSAEHYPDFKGVPYEGNGSPDSLLLSYKAFMQNTDSAEVWLIFFKNGVALSQDIFKFASTAGYVDTAIAIGAEVIDPDSVFIAYASGNTMSGGDTDGNEVWFDQVYFKESDGTLVMAPHGDFEAWDLWISFEMEEITNASASVQSSEDAYAGAYAIAVTSNYDEGNNDPYYDSFTLWGDLVFEENQTLMHGGIPLVQERNMLSFYYKYELADAQRPDTAEAIIYLFDSDKANMVSNNVYLPPSDTFALAQLWYSPDLRTWSGLPDSIAVVFRASKYREQLPAYSLAGNTLTIDSLLFQSEALGEITIATPDTTIANNSNIWVRYENTSGSGITEFLIQQETEQVLAVDYGQEDGNKIFIEASPSDTLVVYARDYYNAAILDSFMVAIEAAPELTLLDPMPDPDFENWNIYNFEYPTGTQTRYTDDGDTALSIEKVASPDGEGYAVKLTNVGMNSMGNNLAYVVVGSGGKDGMAPNAYTGTTPNKLQVSYVSALSGGDEAMIWVQFYKSGTMISSDTLLLPHKVDYGAEVFDLNLSDVDPDSVFMAYASGYVWSDGGADGDYIIIDNVSFRNNEVYAGAPVNANFESWESLTIHQSEAMTRQEGYVRRTEDAASGSYALYMETVRDAYSDNYPFYNPVTLWGNEGGTQGLLVRELDELVFQYKYILADDNYPDTAMAALVLFDGEQDMWFSQALLPTTNTYQEARISLDTAMYYMDFEPTMMRLELVSSMYKEHFDPNYAYEGNALYIDDLSWHSETPSSLELLTQDTTIVSGDPIVLRFAITGSRSSRYSLIAYRASDESMWPMGELINSSDNVVSLPGNYSAGDAFKVYMFDYYNRDIVDSVMVNVDVVSGCCTVAQKGFKIYPVPVNSQLTIESVEAVQRVQLYDVSGVLKVEMDYCGCDFTLDFSSYPQGVYFITLKTEHGVESRRVVKLNDR